MFLSTLKEEEGDEGDDDEDDNEEEDEGDEDDDDAGATGYNMLSITSPGRYPLGNAPLDSRSSTRL